jgi:hypothetical protein
VEHAYGGIRAAPQRPGHAYEAHRGRGHELQAGQQQRHARPHGARQRGANAQHNSRLSGQRQLLHRANWQHDVDAPAAEALRLAGSGAGTPGSDRLRLATHRCGVAAVRRA